VINFVGRRNWYFLISGVIILIGVVSLIVFGLRWGIEFTGGSMITVGFEQEVAQEELRAVMAELGYDDAIIQKTEVGDFLVRTTLLSDEDMMLIRETLNDRFGEEPTVSEPYAVSESIGKEITGYASIAVFVAAIGILLYVTWAFRRLKRPFRFGVCAIVALVHDVLIVLGIFSLLGVFLDIEINAMFITGVLTVIGYSVNDTIVVFDRIRENMARSTGIPLETTVNNSIMDTIGRSLNTSLTTMFVLLALFLLGGVTIHNFVLVLLIGVIVGTYSSICIASQLLVVWENGEFGRLFRRIMPKRVPVRGG
jgi:preprotein translocase subunit SecF